LYLLKRKNDVFNVFIQFQRHVERLLDRKIVHVQTDWGGEYIKLNQFFNNIGISHRVSCPHTHQQNGTAERKHRHIVETGLTLLAHASVPFRFWGDAFSTACFLINRLPTRVINMQTPLERLLGEAPDYSFFRVFGCACWPHLRSYNNRKFEFRSKKCVFLGYSSLHKGYKCLHVPTNRVYISRDVVFDEGVFPFSQLPTPHVESLSHSSPSIGQFDDAANTLLLLPNHGAGNGRGTRLELLDADQSGAIDVHASGATPNHVGSGPVLEPMSPATPASTPSLASPASSAHGSGPPVARQLDLSGAGLDSSSPGPLSPAPAPPQPTRMVTRLQHGVRQPKERTDGTVAWTTICMAHAADRISSEPRDLSDALSTTHWKNAMDAEYQALLKNKTWTLVPPCPGVNVIDSK
jgi:histone deacetylase 1/2